VSPQYSGSADRSMPFVCQSDSEKCGVVEGEEEGGGGKTYHRRDAKRVGGLEAAAAAATATTRDALFCHC